MNILVIDIGGNHVKLWRTDQTEKTKLESGKDLTPQKMVAGAQEAMKDWPIERISIGYPGEVRNGKPVEEPDKLGRGWMEFDFEAAFQCPVRLINDAAMQALGSYRGGRMLYLGFGTGVGSTFITDGVVVPLALGYLKLEDGKTLDHYLSQNGLDKHGKKRWRKAVGEATKMLISAFHADYIVLGGGNIDEIEELPESCQRGGNHNAYFGGLRLWEDLSSAKLSALVS
jgi:polyphosphate glucokinase